ncbi:hypothetical protein EYF80_067641 [Liparis tanakae]|uniref:Uncharacterized protein n=1 Tax=Liparis tanakae TaxID=230148 RepID=A0A4Z2E0F8_9TELE|nr:hypothetical protein EYF80_067641 [Liparis tanakae]
MVPYGKTPPGNINHQWTSGMHRCGEVSGVRGVSGARRKLYALHYSSLHAGPERIHLQILRT